MEERLDNFNSPVITQRRTSIHFRLLGILPFVFFLLQGIHYWRLNELGNMLWMCNIVNLMLAIGLFLNNATLIRVAVLWMIPGLIVWFIYVVWEWGVFFSSTVAHLGGITVGVIALRRVGMARAAWLYALLWYFGLQAISRLLAPAALNVNVAQTIDPGWQGTFNAYWKFWLVLTLAVAAVLWVLAQVLWKIIPNRR